MDNAPDVDAMIDALARFPLDREQEYLQALEALRALYRTRPALFDGEQVVGIRCVIWRRGEDRRAREERLRDFGPTVPLDQLRVDPYEGEMPDYTP